MNRTTPPPAQSRWITTAAAAIYLGVKPRTMRRYGQAGAFGAAYVNRRLGYRFDPALIDTEIARRQVSGPGARTRRGGSR